MDRAVQDQGVLIGLSVVVFALRDGEAVVLTTGGGTDGAGLPFGPFEPARHGPRCWISFPGKTGGTAARR